VLGGVALRAGLGDEVLLVAGQAAEPVQHRAGAIGGLWREVHAHGHVAAEDLGAVAVDVLPASKAGAVFDAFHGSSPERGFVENRRGVAAQVRAAPCMRSDSRTMRPCARGRAATSAAATSSAAMPR